MRLAGSFKDAVAHRRCPGNPGGAGVGWRVPVPVVACGVDLLAGAGGQVFLNRDCGTVKSGVPGLQFYRPALRRTDGSVAACLAFEQEGGAVGHLGNRGVDAEIPYGCSNKVMSRMKKWSQVEALITPMGQVATRGSVADTDAVHEENEAVVGADADWIRRGDRGEVEAVAKVQDDGLAQGRGRMGDPGGFPVAMGGVRQGGGLAVECEGGKEEGKKRKNWSHGIGVSLSSSQA